MPDDDTGDQESLVDESLTEDTGDPDRAGLSGGDEETAGAAPTAADPYGERFERIERENAELRSSVQRMAAGQQGTGDGLPQALAKPQDQWTVKDWTEYNSWMVQHHLNQATAEHATRGQLNAQTLGKGNDYDSIMTKYVRPLAQRNPEIQPFLAQLPAEDRYMIGLLHMIHERSGGDLVKTIQSVVNALGARQEGARDVVRSLTSASRKAARNVFQGGGGRQAGRRPLNAQDVWDLSDDDFRRLESKAVGR